MRTFWGALRAEARSKAGSLLTSTFVVALLDVFIAWRVPGPNLQAVVALLVAALITLYWIFGGLGVFTGRSFPRGVDASTVLVKYLWLLLELVVLAVLLLGSAAYFMSKVLPIEEVNISPASIVLLGVTLGCTLLVPPAIALAAAAVGRSSRWSLLSAFVAFVLLWWAFVLLLDAASGVDVLGWLTLSFGQLPYEVCASETGCFVRVNTSLVVLQPLLATALLWVAASALRPSPEARV